MLPSRPAWKRKRPLGSHRAGSQPIQDTVTWTRDIPRLANGERERYKIKYVDRDGERSDRIIELVKVGHSAGLRAGDGGELYIGVNHAGKFKTMRADRVLAVEQLSQGHEQNIRAFPTYSTDLPKFPLTPAVYRMPTTAVSNRTWTVDLNRYECACPEKRIRAGFGYKPGQLGYVCSHMAKAIVLNLPEDTPDWTPELRSFLADPRKVHIDNLS